MSTCLWEQIHGFRSPNEYRRFVRHIEDQVRAGHAEEITPAPDYDKGCVAGGRWFKGVGSGEIWRLVPPDFPFRGVWEPVEDCHRDNGV